MYAPATNLCPLCSASRVRLLASVSLRPYYRCEVCALTFLDPARHLSADEERGRYAHHRNDPADPRYREFLRRLSGPLIPRLAPGSDGLDFGAGPGPALVAMLAEQGFRMRRFDPYFGSDPDALTSTYDFITCTETAEHFRRPGEEFARLDRLLRPGGWLGIMTSMLESDEGFRDWHYIRDPTHVCFYRRETMEWIARRMRWSLEIPRRDVALFGKEASR